MTLSLVQLQMLARERAPRKRHRLLHEVVDAFFDSSQSPSNEARELFAEVLDLIIADVEEAARQQLAERLAPRCDAPRRVVVRLAGDVIAVAAPVLIRSQVLEDDDLAPLAAEKSQDHLLAIAKRVRLSALITDILIGRGDAPVLDCVAENPGAGFSEAGAEALVDKAATRPALWLLVANRADLAFHLPGWKPDAAITAEPRSAAMREARNFMAARLHAAAARARTAADLGDLIAAGMLSLGEAVIELADGGRVADLAVLIGGRSNCEPYDIGRNLFAADITALMNQCHAAGLDLEAFSAVLRLRRRRLAFAAGSIRGLLRSYQALTDGTTAS